MSLLLTQLIDFSRIYALRKKKIMTEPIKHDLDHEVYIDPKDNKEHINHGMLEYSKEDLESAHAYYDEYHKNDEPETGINDYHLRHQDKKLEVYCDDHPDAFECRVYDE